MPTDRMLIVCCMHQLCRSAAVHPVHGMTPPPTKTPPPPHHYDQAQLQLLPGAVPHRQVCNRWAGCKSACARAEVIVHNVPLPALAKVPLFVVVRVLVVCASVCAKEVGGGGDGGGVLQCRARAGVTRHSSLSPG